MRSIVVTNEEKRDGAWGLWGAWHCRAVTDDAVLLPDGQFMRVKPGDHPPCGVTIFLRDLYSEDNPLGLWKADFAQEWYLFNGAKSFADLVIQGA